MRRRKSISLDVNRFFHSSSNLDQENPCMNSARSRICSVSMDEVLIFWASSSMAVLTLRRDSSRISFVIGFSR